MTSIPLTNYQQKFWLDNPSILYKEYTKFVPTLEMTRAEQVNAITRFFIYLFIIMLLFRRNDRWLLLPVAGIFVITLLYLINISDKEYKEKELARILQIRQNNLDKLNYIDQRELHHDDDDGVRLEGIDTISKNLQVGTYDPDGVLKFNSYNSPYNVNRTPTSKLYSVEEIMEFKKNTSRKPSLENPFMNTNLSHYNNGDVPAASNANDDEISEQIIVNFNHDLYRDVDELWERKNSQRQFYTTPNTSVPNNQTEFAKWLYLVPETCKEDTGACLRYVDLKYQR